jgi:hypothetical protein
MPDHDAMWLRCKQNVLNCEEKIMNTNFMLVRDSFISNFFSIKIFSK